jgi:kynureninase
VRLQIPEFWPWKTGAGLFVHEKHGQVTISQDGKKEFRDILSGWWGSGKALISAMDNHFALIPGLPGFQLSNPSILDITSLNALLGHFAKAGGIASSWKVGEIHYLP